jgi:hypothetical protein
MPWRRQWAPLKHWWTSTRQQGATSQKTVIFTLATLRTWNHTWHILSWHMRYLSAVEGMTKFRLTTIRLFNNALSTVLEMRGWSYWWKVKRTWETTAVVSVKTLPSICLESLCKTIKTMNIWIQRLRFKPSYSKILVRHTTIWVNLFRRLNMICQLLKLCNIERKMMTIN